MYGKTILMNKILAEKYGGEVKKTRSTQKNLEEITILEEKKEILKNLKRKTKNFIAKGIPFGCGIVGGVAGAGISAIAYLSASKLIYSGSDSYNILTREFFDNFSGKAAAGLGIETITSVLVPYFIFPLAIIGNRFGRKMRSKLEKTTDKEIIKQIENDDPANYKSKIENEGYKIGGIGNNLINIFNIGINVISATLSTFLFYYLGYYSTHRLVEGDGGMDVAAFFVGAGTTFGGIVYGLGTAFSAVMQTDFVENLLKGEGIKKAYENARLLH